MRKILAGLVVGFILGSVSSCQAQETKSTSETTKAESVNGTKLNHLQQVGEPSASPRGEKFALKGVIVVQLLAEVAKETEGRWEIQDAEVKKLFEEIGVTTLVPTTYQLKVKGNTQPPTIPNLYRLTIPVDRDILSVASSLKKNPKIVLAKPIYVRLSRNKPQDPKIGLPVAGVISTFPKFEQWDFESEAAKKVTRDFAAVSSDPTQPGDWHMENGELIQGRIPLTTYHPPDTALMHFALLTVYEDHDLKVKVKIKPIDGSLYKVGGIVYRFASLEDYYIVGLDFLNQKIRFERVVKGVREPLMEVDAPDIAKSEPSPFFTLEVVSQGTRCIAFINEKPFINQTDDKLWHGKVGLWTQGDAVTAFDDFTVEAIE